VGPGGARPGQPRGLRSRRLGRITLAHNLGSPAEVDALLEQIAAAGGDVLRPGAETFWGGYSGLFADPDGHRWEVAHNPDWPIAADGSVSLPVD